MNNETCGRAVEATAPAYLLDAARAVLADRERELMELKGPCSNGACRLHYAHSGPCDCRPVEPVVPEEPFGESQ